jgi:hypothetical protein
MQYIMTAVDSCRVLAENTTSDNPVCVILKGLIFFNLSQMHCVNLRSISEESSDGAQKYSATDSSAENHKYW